MFCKDLSRFGLLFVSVVIFFFVFEKSEASESEADLMLLSHILKIGRRVENIEERLDVESVKPIIDTLTEREDARSIIKDVEVKTGQMLNAFGVEKKDLRLKTKEMLGSLNESINSIREINRTTFQNSLRVNNLDQNTNDSVLDLQSDIIENKKYIDKLGLITFNLSKEMTAIQDELNFQKELEKDKTETINRTIDAFFDQIIDIRKELDQTKDAILCPIGWDRQLHSCILYVSTQIMTWTNAQSYCKKSSGILAEPDTDEAFDLLQTRAPGSPDRWYLGASDRNREGIWIWDSKSTPMRLRRWGTNEPNGAGRENCLEIKNNKLNDANCEDGFNFICEIKLNF